MYISKKIKKYLFKYITLILQFHLLPISKVEKHVHIL